jgi:hypothetical protein
MLPNKELRALKALAEQLKSWNVGLYRTMR